MIIKRFRWRNWEPEFVLNDSGKSKVLPVANQKIDFSLGKRFCLGYMKNSREHECPKGIEISSGTQCRACMNMDDNLPCVQCRGFCLNLAKRRECMNESFIIYLACFGSLLKVGISREHRIKQRLVEQGADFGAIISRIKDGRKARIAEQRIGKFLRITDRVRGGEKHAQLASKPSDSIKIINAAVTSLSGSEFSNILSETEIYDLRDYYSMGSEPCEMMDASSTQRIKGQVMSVKGNLIILENSGRFCINANKLVGRELLN